MNRLVLVMATGATVACSGTTPSTPATDRKTPAPAAAVTGLAKLPTTDTLVGTATTETFVGTAAYCEAQKQNFEELAGYQCADISDARAPKPVGPYQQFKVIEVSEGGEAAKHFVVRIANRWHVITSTDLDAEQPGDGRGISELVSIEVRDVVPGGPPEVVVHTAAAQMQGTRNDSGTDVVSWRRLSTRSISICGIGRSNKLSCVGRDYAWGFTEGSAPKAVYKLTLQTGFDARGRLHVAKPKIDPTTIAAPTGPVAPATAARFVKENAGVFALTFE